MPIHTLGLEFKEVAYVAPVPTRQECILVGDIGGTNSNFGLFTTAAVDPQLLLSIHYKSQEITDFAAVVQDLLSYVQATYRLTATRACFAAAGVVSAHKDYCKPTNLALEIDAKIIKQKTGLLCVTIVNDFEIIGYGLRRLKPEQLVQVNDGVARPYGHQIILGAGTGLGKCILIWDKARGCYLPLASEGGHADFAAQTHLEFDLMHYIKETENWAYAISWEDLLSGNGIARIYSFFRHRNELVPADPELAEHGLHPDTIFNNRMRDEHSSNTFALYSSLYARCAKNFALDALALGGVYIAGGIAAKNLPLFQQPLFMKEFVNCGKQHELLKKVPVTIITDYNISLYGAIEYLLCEKACV